MGYINIFLLIIIVIQSVFLLYFIGFHPDAKECMKLEDKLRDAKKENSELLDQIRDLDYQVSALNFKVSQYDEIEVARMKEILNGAMKKYSGTDSDITYDKEENQYRIKSKDN